MKDFYGILEVAHGASPEVVRAAYRQIAKRYHPDNQETGNKAKFLLAKEAYDVLCDPEKRGLYDASLNGQHHNGQQQAQPQKRTVWKNGIGWVLVDDAGPYPGDAPVWGQPTPYPQQPFEELTRQAASTLGHSFVDNLVEQLIFSLRRGGR